MPAHRVEQGRAQVGAGDQQIGLDQRVLVGGDRIGAGQFGGGGQVGDVHRGLVEPAAPQHLDRAGRVGRRGPHPVGQAEPAQQFDAAAVDQGQVGVAGRAGGPLEHHRGHPVAGEFQGQEAAGHAGAHHEHRRTADRRHHRLHLRRPCSSRDYRARIT